MIPRKIPLRDLAGEYAASAGHRFNPNHLRPGFQAPAHPEPEKVSEEAPAAEVPLPEAFNKRSEEGLAREPVHGMDVSEAHATADLDGGEAK